MFSCKNCKYGTRETVDSLTVYCSKFNVNKFHADGCGHFKDKSENDQKLIDKNTNSDTLKK